MPAAPRPEHFKPKVGAGDKKVDDKDSDKNSLKVGDRESASSTKPKQEKNSKDTDSAKDDGEAIAKSIGKAIAKSLDNDKKKQNSNLMQQQSASGSRQRASSSRAYTKVNITAEKRAASAKTHSEQEQEILFEKSREEEAAYQSRG